MPFPTLGRYIVESQLGEGGMGVVLRARDPELNRIVAIKVLPPDQVVDADHKRRFLQEAKAASALNHPNIVTIHDVGVEGDTYFIVMEYVPGSTLDRRVSADGLPVKKALFIAIAIADALAKAHEAGIIHRDLKPSNVMITDEGVVKVLDFGIAKLLEPSDASDATRTVLATAEGTTVGTPGYMSPEQAEGRRLDARSDIFSFGAVLYEMLTGRQAFTGSSRLSVLGKVLSEEPTPPSQLVPSIPPDLEKAVLRCLRKDPARRYQSMADLRVALQDVLDDLATGSQPRPDVRPSSTRRPWAIAAGLALVLGAGYGAWWLTQAPEGANGPMQAVPLTSLPGQVRFPAMSPDGNHVAFAWSGPAQDNSDVYVQRIAAGSPLRLTTDLAGDSSPAWSPDGRAIAFLRRTSNSAIHELRLIPPLGGPERKVADIRPANPLYRTADPRVVPRFFVRAGCRRTGRGQARGAVRVRARRRGPPADHVPPGWRDHRLGPGHLSGRTIAGVSARPHALHRRDVPGGSGTQPDTHRGTDAVDRQRD